MSLRISDITPDFTPWTTAGPVSFHDWIGTGWAIMFSHPRDFTPVRTTEPGPMAGIAGEFTGRNARIIGISVDRGKPQQVEGRHQARDRPRPRAAQSFTESNGDSHPQVIVIQNPYW